MANLKIDYYGNKFWYSDEGLLHREDGPAIEHANGDKSWYINGKCHREDGPAIEQGDGTKWWYINGKCHREDGPAIEWCNGSKDWYYDGRFIGTSYYGYTQEKFEKYLRSLKIKEYW